MADGCATITFARVSLTFDQRGRLRQPVHRKVSSFRATARPWRPEVNARQRYAPSGANVFGLTVIAARGKGVRRDTNKVVITREGG